MPSTLLKFPQVTRRGIAWFRGASLLGAPFALTTDVTRPERVAVKVAERSDHPSDDRHDLAQRQMGGTARHPARDPAAVTDLGPEDRSTCTGRTSGPPMSKMRSTR